jgi:ABC-type nitrate/sulfonate/bicarbonate transport system substrate-binding protein
MRAKHSRLLRRSAEVLLFGSVAVFPDYVGAADRLTGLHSAQVMSQSMPWIAQEAGLFKKYDLDFRLVFIPSSPVATAATLNGDAEIGVTGAVGNVRAFVQGFTDLVFIAGMKNILTHSVLGKPEIKRPEDLKGKKVGVGRFGGNTHYFVIQALKRLGMDATKDIQTIQTGGGAGNIGGAGERQRGRSGSGRAWRLRRGGARISLRDQRSRDANSVRRHASGDAALRHQQTGRGDRPVHARHGGSFEDHPHRQSLRL